MMMTRLNPTEPIATFEASVSKERFSKFFKAVNWQLLKVPVMPPTLATAFRDGEFAALKKLNIALHKVLHGEQKYRFHKPLLPEVNYRGETYLTNHYEKSGGSGTMNFYVFETKLLDQTGDICVECATTIIAKG